MYWRICLALSTMLGGLFTAYLIRDALSGPNYQTAVAESWPIPADQFKVTVVLISVLGGIAIVFLGTAFGAWIDGSRAAAKRRRADNEAAVRRAKMEAV